MFGGGLGSSMGDMMSSSGFNIWENKYKSQFMLYSHNNDLLFLIGIKFSEFNFMKRVASYNKGNKFSTPYPNETYNNYSDIEKALSMKYLPLPENIRNFSYCCKTKDVNPKYFIIDYPAYNFKYTNHRFLMIENEILKELKIKNFLRCKDGGTTKIIVIDEDGNEHVFFSPTPLSQTQKHKKYDDIELIDATEVEKIKLLKILNMDLINSNTNDSRYYLDKTTNIDWEEATNTVKERINNGVEKIRNSKWQ
jgi:uncharacterized protein YrzB (UPF0473 family)